MPNPWLEVFLSRSTLRPPFNRKAGQNPERAKLYKAEEAGIKFRPRTRFAYDAQTVGSNRAKRNLGRKNRTMRQMFSFVFLILMVAALTHAKSKEEKRLEKCAKLMEEILNVPENIPLELLDKAECIAVIPSVKKFALGLGGSYGAGVFMCRRGKNFKGAWSPPAMYRLEGASIGFQLGGSATDFVLLVMNPKGADAIIRSKVKLGVDASAAAGPKGRTAEAATDVTMRAEILTYSRARGLFGTSTPGTTRRSCCTRTGAANS